MPNRHVEIDENLVDEGAVRILLADEYESDGPFTEDQFKWARLALGIGEDLAHDGDCTNQSYTCRLCAREAYQRQMRAAMAAIDASGTHWLAPWESPLGGAWVGSTEDCWAELRDACLAERRKSSDPADDQMSSAG